MFGPTFVMLCFFAVLARISFDVGPLWPQTRALLIERRGMFIGLECFDWVDIGYYLPDIVGLLVVFVVLADANLKGIISLRCSFKVKLTGSPPTAVS